VSLLLGDLRRLIGDGHPRATRGAADTGPRSSCRRLDRELAARRRERAMTIPRADRPEQPDEEPTPRAAEQAQQNAQRAAEDYDDEGRPAASRSRDTYPDPDERD
jgi:hypothetical protein